MTLPRAKRLSWLLSTSLLAISTAAAAAPSGEVGGTVRSNYDNKPLGSAQVIVVDNGETALTSPNGRYDLRGVPAGPHRLNVTVGNNVVASQIVDVRAGAAVSQDFAASGLGAASAQPEQVHVFGRRNPQAVARKAEFTALNSVNIQSAQEIGKYPDVSAAEALSRVPGVSLEIDTGEGRFVNIRGLDADLNGYTFGGVPLPASSPASPFGGGRAVAFDAIPAGFIGQIEVTKTLRPDQDAQGLGGQIEITPKTVLPDSKPFVEGQLGTGIEPLRNKPLAQGELTAGASFGLDRGPFTNGYKPFSVLATGEVYNDSRGVDDLERSYTDQQDAGVPDKVLSSIELRRYTSYRRHRYGYGGELAFQPNVDNRWYVRYSESGYSEQVNRQRQIFSNLDNSGGVTDANGNAYAAYLPDPANPNGFLAPAAQLLSTLRDEGETLRDKVFTAGGENSWNGFTVDYHGAWTSGTYDKGHDYNSTFGSQNLAVAYDNVSKVDYPTYRIQPGFNYLDPNNYALSSLVNQTQHDQDVEYSGVANVAHPLDLFTGTGTFKFGGSIRRRTRSVTQINQNYTPTGMLSLAQLNVGSQIHSYYGNHYLIPGEPNSDQVRALIGSTLLTRDVGADAATDLGAFERDHENVYAGYAQYAWEKGPFSVLSGVRFERTEADYGAYGTNTDANGIATTTYGVRHSQYNDYFPTVQARYAITPRLIARLSYSTGIARPGFNQISGSRNIDIGANTVTGGNPNLVPTTLDDFEGALQWYTQRSGILSVGAFDKELHNYIFARATRGFIPEVPGIIFNTVGFANGGDGRATGVEFNYHQLFYWLPPVLSGFGLDANYTHVESQGSVHPGMTQVLPSTAPDTINLALFYEKYDITARLAFDYVGRNLFGVGSSPATDIYSEARPTLDLSTQYQFADNFKYYFNVRNLLNTPLKFTEGASDRPIQREYYDVTIQTGIKFDF